jgi:NHL repeat
MSNPDFEYAFVDDWCKLPAGWRIGDVGGVAVDAQDLVYVFNRGAHPMLVFDPRGDLVDSWGEGAFTSPHGVHLGWDGFLYCTDDGDHTVRKFDLRGQLHMEIGVPGKPSAFMSGEPFNRCTHAALSPSGDIYVSDGYRNACVHCFSARGDLLRTWGESGSMPGQFYVPHNIACDEAGIVYVADRENHRVQLFDAAGQWQSQWNDLHRPMALWLERGQKDRAARMYVGEAGPSYNTSFPNLGPRISVIDTSGRLLARFGDIGYGHAADRFIAPHGIAVDSRGDIYVGEVAHAAWPTLYPGQPAPADLRTLRKLRRVGTT